MDDRARKEAGVAAENAALQFLVERGLRLICRNYRCRGGEIDLVMMDAKTLVLVEVRYRSSLEYGGAAASVTWQKQRRLIVAARHLLNARRQLSRFPARFDVIAINSGEPRRPRIEWLKAAFVVSS